MSVGGVVGGSRTKSFERVLKRKKGKAGRREKEVIHAVCSFPAPIKDMKRFGRKFNSQGGAVLLANRGCRPETSCRVLRRWHSECPVRISMFSIQCPHAFAPSLAPAALLWLS